MVMSLTCSRTMSYAADVPPGNRRTDIIPPDWRMSTVGAEFKVELGKMLDSARNAGIPKLYIGNRSVQWGRIDLTDVATVRMTPADLQRFGLRRGDLLVCEGGEIGRAAIWDEMVPECYYQKALHRLRPLRCYDVYLMMSLLQLWASTGHLANYVTQTSIAHLPKDKLEEVPLPVPPEPEQRAIAEVLSDVDGLLSALDALIAKKRAIKQAVMQQLLTGKTRLPGFEGKWETKRLGEIGDISGAGVDKKFNMNEIPVRLVNYLDVYHKTFLYSEDLVHEVSAKPNHIRRCVVEKGDIFFTPTSEVRNDIGRSAVAMEDIPDGAYSYHVVRLRLKKDWDLHFRAYAFDTKSFLDQANKQCEGSGTRYVITLPKFRSMVVRFPPSVEEQAAIATVLSDMDAEIAALEQRRDKTRAMKQGMMQALLTGRVRLVEPGMVEA